MFGQKNGNAVEFWWESLYIQKNFSKVWPKISQKGPALKGNMGTLESCVILKSNPG